MKEADKNDLLHSEPVQEILGSIPAWITRWGVTIIFALFALIIFGSCLIEYPQTLSAPILVIVSENGEVSGQMSVPSSGFGKVQVGQTVNVKLDSYPYMDYGVLKGEITSFQSVPDHTDQETLTYPTYVSFTSGLVVENTGIPFGQLKEMSGTADIIVQSKKLIEHFIRHR